MDGFICNILVYNGCIASDLTGILILQNVE